MSERIEIHPVNPQPRLLRRVVDCLRSGGVIAYPTDSSYAFGCQIGDKGAQERIQRIRRLDEKTHNFTLVCRDLSEISTYARVDNAQFRLLKALTPGPFTFILRATHEVPRRLQNPKRKTIGIRIPGHPVDNALLDELGEPIMSSSLLLPGDDLALGDPNDVEDQVGSQIDLIIDGGLCAVQPTTVLDLVEGLPPVLVRQGKGDASAFLD
ncbi:L-threonylcarbamoyladenylate synthase [Plasticicumulans acidivorans]|uniref:Translation factor SUA5 n=1 Tax=Plasticicumulans acidivorans TaxID=886464 RepID=A0A317MWX7_9GAMM|nr:L-threonylcarbamoyladenylate synthase [Plasticicumulans acidivorans]PWV59469.1 translation factor SUA5 [Plasticicumulans acidivorans]